MEEKKRISFIVHFYTIFPPLTFFQTQLTHCFRVTHSFILFKYTSFEKKKQIEIPLERVDDPVGRSESPRAINL